MLKKAARLTVAAVAALSLIATNAAPEATAKSATAPDASAVKPQATPPGSATAAEFQLVVFGDTQNWVLGNDARFSNAATWIRNNAQRDNTRYVLHTGDVTNWGWAAPDQVKVAKNAMNQVRQAGIPYQLSLGNHDTRAVGWNGVQGSRTYGGDAYVQNPECRERYGWRCESYYLIRQTAEVNQSFPADSTGETGRRFGNERMENSYSTFKAGGRNWLTITLEMSPRENVVKWAGDVVQQFPNHNVIVQTHSYLASDGSITKSNSGYGATTGQYLYDNLIGKYANIRLVFSGHTGKAAARVDKGVNGNSIISMLQNDVTGNTGNAIRLVKINGTTGQITSRIYAPNQTKYYTEYDKNWTIGLR